MLGAVSQVIMRGDMQAVLTTRQIALFDGLDSTAIRTLLARLSVKHYLPGQTIFKVGEPASSFFILQRGLVKVSYINLNGEEKIINIYEPGEIFGELFLGKYPYRIGQAVALDSVTVYRMHQDELFHLIEHFPQVSINFIRHLVDGYRETLARLHALLRFDARTRLLGTLLSLARRHCCSDGEWFMLNPAITQEDLANMAGLNRSTVSSLINELRRDGIMGGTGRHLKVNRRTVELHLCESGFEILQ
jgi:CRP-like cAMP-binding protein